MNESADGMMSVVTAAHDAAGTIERTIACVAGQTMPVHENIIVDDGSRDATAAVVRGLQRVYPNLMYIYQARKGSGAARNCGIRYASGR